MNDITQRAREFVSQLREEAAKRLTLAQTIEMSIEGVGDPNQNRLSTEGRERARQGAKNSWLVCPRPDCKVKHRRNHPHIKRSARQVGDGGPQLLRKKAAA